MKHDLKNMNESLAHLHRALVDALAARVHHTPNQPVTVAEIYQDLIPYRNVRTTLGFAMNADYEHVLLQMLAGDGGFVKIEPPQVQEELRLELRSSNPNVGVFRNYAACDVFVSLPADFEKRRQAQRGNTPAQSEAFASPAAPSAPRGNGPPAEHTQRPAGTVQTAPLAAAAVAPAVQPPPRQTAPVRVAEPVATACIGCKRVLPASRKARFCPFCGTEQTRSHCTQCREPIEPGWKFCVACGTPAT